MNARAKQEKDLVEAVAVMEGQDVWLSRKDARSAEKLLGDVTWRVTNGPISRRYDFGFLQIENIDIADFQGRRMSCVSLSRLQREGRLGLTGVEIVILRLTDWDEPTKPQSGRTRKSVSWIRRWSLLSRRIGIGWTDETGEVNGWRNPDGTALSDLRRAERIANDIVSEKRFKLVDR